MRNAYGTILIQLLHRAPTADTDIPAIYVLHISNGRKFINAKKTDSTKKLKCEPEHRLIYLRPFCFGYRHVSISMSDLRYNFLTRKKREKFNGEKMAQFNTSM